MRLSASALNEGKNSLDESIALITAANEVVNDPSSVGTALKTLTLRLRGSKTELEEMGEDVTDMATTTSQLQAKLLALTGGKVDIMLDANTFKNTTQILREMADAWDNMNDIQRASALELMGGKRQANTLSALIQNFDTVEEAIEASAKSAGSALEENERYLDSIQGKIDQFNNALQSMWNNVLDDDLIKIIVQAGTELLKLIDNLGVLKTLIMGIGTYVIQKNFKGDLWGSLLNAESIDEVKVRLQGLKDEIATLQGKRPTKLRDVKITSKQKKYDKFDAYIKEYDELEETLKRLRIENDGAKKALDDYNTKLTNKAAKGKQITDKEIAQQNQLNMAYEQSNKRVADTEVALKKAEIQALKTGTAGLGAGNKIKMGFISGAKAVGRFVGQLAMSMAHMAAMTAAFELLTKIGESLWGFFDDKVLGDSVEELQEKFIGLESELSNAESEIDRLNNELDTTNETLADLLAKDSLSFTEQEELERLQIQSAELERQVTLAKELRDNLQMSVNEAAINATGAYLNETSFASTTTKSAQVEEAGSTGQAVGTVIGYAAGTAAGTALGAKIGGSVGTFAGPIGTAIGVVAGGILGTIIGKFVGGKKYEDEQTVQEAINSMPKQRDELKKIRDNAYKAYIDNPEDEELKTIWNEASANLATYDQNMAKHVSQIQQAYNAIAITDDTDASTRAYKQQLGDIIDQYNMAMGGKGAKEVAINRVFTDGGFEEEKEKIDEYVKALADGDKEAADKITSLIDNNQVLKDAFSKKNLDPQDAIDYFTKIGREANFTTIEGKTEDIRIATEKLGSAFRNIGRFMDGNKVDTVAIAEYFQGTSEATRTEIAKLVKNINDGEITVSQALKSFAAYGMVESWKIIETEVSELNTNVFKDLGDEISGIINTVSELSAAFEDVSKSIDLVSQAEAEMAYSGHLSVETALQLMESTDDWNKVLKIEEGNIKLVDGAEQVLVQTKLDLIKKNLQTALSTVEAQLAQISATEASADMAYTIEESTNLAVTQLAGNMAYLTEMMTAYTRAAAGETVDMSAVTAAAEEAKKQVLAATDYQKNTAERIGREDLEKEKARLEAMLGMYETVDTPSEFKSNYSSDEVSGGNADKDSAEDDKITDGWEKLLAKYENLLALITNERDLIETEIDRMEAQGGKASAEYYEDLIRSSAEEKALLEEKKKALEEYLAANAGAIDQDTWTDYNNEINETAVAIKECEINTLEWAEAIREIDLHYFEQASDEISRLGDELEFVNGLLEDEEVADENGNWSSAALTRMGMYTNQMEMAAANAARYQEQIDDLNEEYSNGAISEEQYQERLSDLVGSQQDAIMSYEDAKDSIVELNEARVEAIREGIEKEIEAYQDLTDAKKEELDAERDLHDFRKNIQKQTKDISELERRIASLSGSSAASDVAERRKLEAQLMEAKEGLNDTYYDHSHNAMSTALDEENEAYALSKERYIERLEEQLEDTETLIQNSIMDVMLNADTVYNELNTLANTYGVTLSDELTLPWKNASTQAIKWKDELKESMTSGEYASLIGEGGAVTAFANGVATKLTGSWSKAQTAAKNYAGYLTGAELKNRFTSTLTGFGAQIQSIIDKWNGVKKAADDAYYAQTRKVTVGGTGSGDTGGSGSSSGSGSGGGGTVVKPTEPTVKLRGLMKTSRDMILGPKSFVDENTETINGVKYYRDSKTGYYYKISDLDPNRITDLGRSRKWAIPKGTWFYTKHAQGTTGTSRDEWALTDEPQFGDELVLVPGKDGNLSFMRKGTGVVPADMTQKLFELAQIPTSDLMNKNLTAIVPNITKNDFKNEFNFESLVHVDTVDSDTLPKLEKMVDKKIDDFSRALNYSLKKFSR